MALYRKKPVVVAAEQFLPEKRADYCAPEGVTLWRDWHGPAPRDMSWGFIDTLEGRMHVMYGDWIITGIAGERYPCKPEIFEATYEAAGGDE